MIPLEELKHRIEFIRKQITELAIKIGRNPDDITVVAVSKTHPPELLLSAVEAGITIFGENYAQEMKTKYDFIKKSTSIPIKWHFIGHLQTNKVKYIAPFVELIHSVDTFHLAQEISRQGGKLDRVINVLLQVNTSGEMSKFGCSPEDILKLCEDSVKLKNIRIIGLMTIGSFSEDETIYRREFKLLAEIRKKLIEKFPEIDWKHLSMGMSHDYLAAIEEGATIVRIGTALFGERQYS
jgi:pyridoxal phosphate enzyme (YggS family)